mgnify:FL=1
MKKTLFTAGCTALIAAMLLCACAPVQTQPATEGTQMTTPTAGTTPETPALPEWRYDFIKSESAQYDYGKEEQYVPFWQTNVIYNECFCFVAGENGEAPTGRLRFTPKRIISVRDWTLKKEYVEGRDYTFDKGTLTFTRTENSSAPYFTRNFLSGKNEDGSLIEAFAGYDKAPWSTLGYARWDKAIYCIGPELYQKQVFVTYEYDPAEFDGPAQQFQGARLKNTMAKLLSGSELSVLFYGDSIPYGCDSSGMYHRQPNQDGFPKMFTKALSNIYGSKVRYKNTAVGGTTTQWAKENVDSEVIAHNPDLVVLMTGGNDGDATEHSEENIAAAVRRIKEKLPRCEIILMDTFVGNKDGGFASKIKPMLEGIHDRIAQSEEGVATAGIFRFHTYMLEGKNYIDFSGNGINHPNDYMIRLYAQQLLSTVVDFDAIKARG